MDDESSQSKRMRLPSDNSADYNKVLHTSCSTSTSCNCDRCGSGGGAGGGAGHGHVTIIDLDWKRETLLDRFIAYTSLSPTLA